MSQHAANVLGLVVLDLVLFCIVYGTCFLQAHGTPPEVDDDTMHLW